MRVIEQLAGVGLPASLWESQILPARVRDYSPEMLDELLATGAVIWSGAKKLGEDDGLVALHLQEYAAESFTPAEADQANRSALQQAIVAVLADGGALGLHNKSANGYATKSANRLISLPCKRRYGRWSGKASSPATFGHRYAPSPAAVPTHAHLNSPQSPGSSWTSCLCATRLAAGILQHTKSGWTLVVIAGGATKRYRKDAGAGGKYARPLRHHQSSGGDSRKYPPGGFPSMQTLCRSMEDSGRIMRGRFVEGLGGAQFAERLTIDRLRDLATQATQTRHYTPVALSANDPANVWGNLLPRLHIRQRWFQRVGRVRWWSFLAANCYSIWRKVAKKCWSGRKKRNYSPQRFSTR